MGYRTIAICRTFFQNDTVPYRSFSRQGVPFEFTSDMKVLVRGALKELSDPPVLVFLDTGYNRREVSPIPVSLRF